MQLPIFKILLLLISLSFSYEKSQQLSNNKTNHTENVKKKSTGLNFFALEQG